MIQEVICKISENQNLIALLTMVATCIAACAASYAAYATMKGAKSWKEQSDFETKRDAVSAWVSGAATFRGRLKFVYKKNVKWPEDKKEIEYVSEHFGNLVALWPSAKASLSGELRTEAENLWQDVFTAYSAFMSGSYDIEQLGLSIEAIYNSELLNKVVNR